MASFMNIIPASEHHIPVIRSIAFATWPTAFGTILSQAQIDYMLDLMYNESELRKRMSNPNRNFYLYKHENEFVAFLVLEKDYNGEKQFKVEKIYVLPQKQGLGIGQQLLEFTETTMKEAGYSTLILDVNRRNAAVQFYQKLGFSILKEVDTDIGQGFYMEDYVMQKLLSV